MYWLNTMQPYKVYRNKPFLYPLADEKQKYSGNLILLDTKDINGSISIINHSLINNKYTRCYYIDKINYAQIKTMKKKTIVNQSNLYKKVKSNCKSIIKTYPTLDSYNGLSLYYDLHAKNEVFYNNAIYAPKQKLIVYKTFMDKIFDDTVIASYPNKYIVTVLTKEDDSYEIYREKLNSFFSILLYTAFYNEELIVNYPNLTMIIVGATSGRCFYFPLHSLSKHSLPLIKRLMTMILKLEKSETLTEEEIQEEEATDKDSTIEAEDTSTAAAVTKDTIKAKLTPTTSTEKEVAMKVNQVIDTNAKGDYHLDIEDSLNNDEEFLKFLEELKQEKLTAELASRNTARNEVLKEEQKQIKINNDKNFKTMEEILLDTEKKLLEKEELKIPKDGKNALVLNKSTLRDFEKSYNTHLDYKDKMTILNDLSSDNREIKVYIRNIKKEDSSVAFTKKETWTIDLEDEHRVRHTIKVDLPTFIDDKFLYIEGNKKLLNKQLVLLPITKTKPDEVQLVTNSNKTFVSRFGNKTSPKMEKFKKFLAETKNNNRNSYSYNLGNNTVGNEPYLTNLEYDEIAESYTTITIKSTTIYFSQELIRDEFIEKKIKLPTDKKILPIGFSNNEPILYNMDTNELYIGKEPPRTINLIDYILELIFAKDKNLYTVYDSLSIPKKYTYSRCSILNRKIPLILFLAYNEGLSTILHKAKINYELTDKRRNLTHTEKETKGMIPFKDKYLYYDLYPMKNSLLLNGLLEIDTEEYEYELYDSKDIYLDIFFNMYGSRVLAKGYDNFYELFIDGITKEVLEDHNYPTTVTELFLYANALLQDNQYIVENDMSNYRIRSNEIINIILMKEIEAAYIAYKNSRNGATPIKISLPKDAVIKALATNKYGPIMQDYDTLNPTRELDSISTVTFKGPGGLTKYILFSPL